MRKREKRREGVKRILVMEFTSLHRVHLSHLTQLLLLLWGTFVIHPFCFILSLSLSLSLSLFLPPTRVHKSISEWLYFLQGLFPHASHHHHHHHHHKSRTRRTKWITIQLYWIQHTRKGYFKLYTNSMEASLVRRAEAELLLLLKEQINQASPCEAFACSFTHLHSIKHTAEKIIHWLH